MPKITRAIGPIGTTTRLLVGSALVLLALLHGQPWGIQWYEVVLGLAVFPAFMLSLDLTLRHYTSHPVRLTGSAATAVNCIVIVVLLVNPLTQAAAELFYSASLLVAAWRGQAGCEATVIPNWILRRDDQIGCPMFSPIDHAESRHNARTEAGR